MFWLSRLCTTWPLNSHGLRYSSDLFCSWSLHVEQSLKKVTLPYCLVSKVLAGATNLAVAVMAGDWLDTYSLQRGSFQQARFFVWYVYFLVVLNLTWLDIYKEVRCPIWNPSPQEFYLGIGLGSGLDLAHLDLQACLYSLHRKFQNLISTKSCWSHRASPNTVSESATCEPASGKSGSLKSHLGYLAIWSPSFFPFA